MTKLKETLDGIWVNCQCPFSHGADRRTLPLKEMLKIAGYLTTAKEIRYIDVSLAKKKDSDDLNPDERMLVEQIHEEIKALYDSVSVEVEADSSPPLNESLAEQNQSKLS